MAGEEYRATGGYSYERAIEKKPEENVQNP
jgi:hypothetical protein